MTWRDHRVLTLIRIVVFAAGMAASLWFVSNAMLMADTSSNFVMALKVHTVYWLLFPGPQIVAAIDEEGGLPVDALTATMAVMFSFWFILALMRAMIKAQRRPVPNPGEIARCSGKE